MRTKALFSRYPAWSWVGLISFGTFLAGCDWGVEPSSGEIWELSTREGAPLESVGPVATWWVRGGSVPDPNDVWLVEGEVSSASSDRLRDRDPTGTTEDHRLRATVWREGDRVAVRPVEPLVPGESYSLAILGVGLVGRAIVREGTFVLMERVGSAIPGAPLSYCLPIGAPAEAVGWLEEAQSASEDSTFELGLVGTDLFADRCLSHRIDGDPGTLFLPDEIRSHELGLDPAPVEIEEMPGGAAAPLCGATDDLGDCVRSEGGGLVVSLGVGTFGVRIVELREPDVVLEAPIEWLGERLVPGVVGFGPLSPETEYQVELIRLDPRGPKRGKTTIRSGAAAGHLVLNEVLANPLGPEPASEWIELANVGTAPISLAGFMLRDSTGLTPLPDGELEPGAFGLIVRGDFVVDPVRDVLPSRAAVRIEVSEIGRSGLLNAGEALELVDPAGDVVSRMPAREAGAGVSLARIDPWLPDDPASFASHGEPGASPGAPNVFDEGE